MGIVHSNKQAKTINVALLIPSLAAGHRHCFMCHKIVGYPYIYWSGNDGEKEGEDQTIVMHPGCAADLAMRLARDVVELKMRFNPDTDERKRMGY